MIPVPCKECTRRSMRCHSECKDYIEFAKKMGEARKQRLIEQANQQFNSNKSRGSTGLSKLRRSKKEKMYENNS